MVSPFGWKRYVDDQGAVLGISTSDSPADGDTIVNQYGFTVENILEYTDEIFSEKINFFVRHLFSLALN